MLVEKVFVAEEKIMLGDIFEDVSSEWFYVLTPVDRGRYALVSLNIDIHAWQPFVLGYFKDFDEATGFIIECRDKKLLKHYPKNKYKLVLTEI